MEIKSNYPLSELTTFRVGGRCSFYAQVSDEAELREAVKFAKTNNVPVLILGGGSNLLVSDLGFNGLVIQVAIKGKEIVKESEYEVIIKVGAGEVWDEVVAYTIEKNLWGIENLSNIPGYAGAVPVQNVGAYGQEASFVIENVEVLDLTTLEKKVLINAECGFAYRASNFNTSWKNMFAILSVSFKLAKLPQPNLTYADVSKYFANNTSPTQKQIREAIIEIRKNKFPDLQKFGTAGSFFKNLLLTPDEFNSLQNTINANFGAQDAEKLMEVKNKFPQTEKIKIPAAFLIDLCGLKGRETGGARLWERQPLVIVTTPKASASDVLNLYNLVRSEVFQRTGMELSPEPEFIGFNLWPNS